jgi:hypothetical protein
MVGVERVSGPNLIKWQIRRATSKSIPRLASNRSAWPKRRVSIWQPL